MLRAGLSLLLLLAAIFAHEAHASTRVRTTNVTESAPLNAVARAFSKIQSSLNANIESERVSYKILVPNAPTSAVRDLLINMAGGPLEAQVTSLEEVSSPAPALDDFMARGEMKVEADRASVLQRGFVSAVKSALIARTDVKFYVADVTTRSETERVLILRDDETHDLLVMDLSRR